MFNSIKIPKELIPSDPRFASGPSLVPQEFVQKLSEQAKGILGTSHRAAPVKDMVADIQNGIREFFDLPKDYEVVLGNGGATCFFDICGTGLVKKKSEHFICGEFSSKWEKAHSLIPWIETQKTLVDYGEGFDFDQVSPDKEPDVICATLNETSTGSMICGFPKIESDQLLVIDATSGGGQIPWPVEKTDVFFFSPQKVFAGEGGLWVAIFSPKAVKRAMEITADSSRFIPQFYNLKPAIENSRKNQTFTTPALSGLFFLREQVRKMNDQTSESVYEEGKEKADLIYNWAKDSKFATPFIQKSKFRSNTVATIDFDEKYPVSDLLKVFKEQNVAVDIAGYRKLGRNQIRIALFHNVKKSDIEKLLGAIDYAVSNC